MELPPEGLVLEQQPAIAHQAVELGQQLVEDHRLHQVVLCAAAERGDGILDRGIGGDHHDQRLGPDLEQPVEQAQAVEARELHVAEGDVRLEPLDQGQRLAGVGGRRDLVALALKELLERRGDHLLVIDDQDPAPRRDGSAALVSPSGFASGPTSSMLLSDARRLRRA